MTRYKPYQFNPQDAYNFARHVGIQVSTKGGNLHFKQCPYCKGSGKQNEKSFAIDLTTGTFNCLRSSCEAKGNMLSLARDFDFSLGTEIDEYYNPKKQFRKLPTPKEPITPKPEALQYLEKRGIGSRVANLYEITVQKDKPNILVFPFYDEKGVLQFVKYRKTDYDKEKDSCKEWCEKETKPILFGMKQCNLDNKTLILTEGQCFNGDAEIMTPTGWIRLKDYGGENVLQVNSDMSANFVKPKAYIVKKYDGDMVDVSIGGNYFTSTTADHNIVLVDKNGQVVKKKAADKISTVYHIPTAIKFDSDGCGLLDEELALLLAISADGTIDSRKNGTFYARFGLTKERKVKRLRDILEKLGYEYSDSVLGKRGKEYHSICFAIKNNKIACKFLPWWLVTQTTLKQKKFLVEEMVWLDGNHVNNRNQYEYMSVYKHNADVMQAIATTAGYMSTVMTKKSGGNGEFVSSFVYKVSVLLGKNNVSTQSFEKQKSIRKVSQMVYCVSVDSGMILVRQDNKISVSGNCDSLSVAEANIENAVSVPTGCKGFTWIPYCWDWVNKFDEIIIFGDHEKGKITLLDEISQRFNHLTIKHVREEDYLDCKDANDILKKYGTVQIKKCIENAIEIPMKQIIDMADVQITNPFDTEKLKTGINVIDNFLYGGLPFGFVHILAGKRGQGKSSFGSQLASQAVKQGYNTFIYSGEMTNGDVKSWLYYQMAGINHVVTNNKDGIESWFLSNGTINAIDNWIRGKMFLFDESNIENEDSDLVRVIEEMIRKHDCRVILLDNLMTAIEMDSNSNSDELTRQKELCKKLRHIAKRYNVLILLVAHRRKDDTSTDINDAVSGSAYITNIAGIVMDYAMPKEQDNNYVRYLKIAKNRVFGKVNYDGFGLQFEEKTKRIFNDKYKDPCYSLTQPWEEKFLKVEQEETPFDFY